MKKVLLIMLLMLAVPAAAETCGVYITGIGCPNCAATDPVLLTEYTQQHPDLVIIEYEIYKDGASNQKIANEYFKNYLPGTRPGVPLLIFDKNTTALGKFQVIDAEEEIIDRETNHCPMPNGSSQSFEEIDITALPGKIKIWTKGMVLESAEDGNNEALKKVLKDISALDSIEHEDIEPRTVELSGAKLEFENSAVIEGWKLSWNEKQIKDGITPVEEPEYKIGYLWIVLGLLIGIGILFYWCWIRRKKVCKTETHRKFLIIAGSILILIALFAIAKYIPYDSLEKLGYSLPLPIFTLLIALIDGFNPCNLFVLTMLLGLLVSASHSRKKIFTIAYTFITVVLIIYFFFMAAWLNIFKYIGFIDPLRIGIAAIAIIAGLINCKELFAFRKGITLMVQEQHKGPLVRRIQKMKNIITSGSTFALIAASISLAAFASLVELPCTAGFPIIYTGILTGKVLSSSISYYLYLLLYNIIYVVPLIVVVTIFGYTFKGKQISKRQMQIIKFIGGLIMLALGIILLVNPGLIGIGM